MRIVDISQEVLSCNVYPGDPSPEAEKLNSMYNGDLYNLSLFSMCAHNGTHIDAPAHFIKDGKTVDELSAETFIGYCYVAIYNGDLTAADAVEIIAKSRAAGADERILIRGNVTVTEDAAREFAKAKLKLFGNEGQSVGPVDAPMKVHQILLEVQTVLLEGIVLDNISEGKYFLSALPLNLKGFEGSPCRAYLIEF